MGYLKKQYYRISPEKGISRHLLHIFEHKNLFENNSSRSLAVILVTSDHRRRKDMVRFISSRDEEEGSKERVRESKLALFTVVRIPVLQPLSLIHI